jgi:glucose/arabinose dehydrogenase
MRSVARLRAAAAALFYALVAGAEQNNNTCSNILTPSYTSPVVASGWVAQLIAKDLKSPRSIQWDSNGHLLVVQQGVGIQRLTFTDNGRTCLQVNESKSVVDDTGVCIGLDPLAGESTSS